MAELREYKPTLRDKARYAIQDTLMGLGVDPYEAGKWGGKVAGGNNVGAAGLGLLDFTPAAIPMDLQEARRSYEGGNYVDALFQGLGGALGLAPLAGPILKNAPDFVRSQVGALQFPKGLADATPEQQLWAYLSGPHSDYPEYGSSYSKGLMSDAVDYYANKEPELFDKTLEYMKNDLKGYGIVDEPENPFYVPDNTVADAEGLIDVEDIDWDNWDIGDLDVGEISGEGILDKIVNEVSAPKTPTITPDNAHELFKNLTTEQQYEFFTGAPFSKSSSYGYTPEYINEDVKQMSSDELSEYMNKYFKGENWGGDVVDFELNKTDSDTVLLNTLGTPEEIAAATTPKTYVDYANDGSFEDAIDALTPEQTTELMYMQPYSVIKAGEKGSTAADKQFLKELFKDNPSAVKGYFDNYVNNKPLDGGDFEFNSAPDALSRSISSLVAKDKIPVEQQIMDLLKAGRGSEVTNTMMREANQQKLTDMYDLPMDLQSRMGRATGMGAPLDETGQPQVLYQSYPIGDTPGQQGYFDWMRGDPKNTPGRYNASFAAENPRFADRWAESRWPEYGVKELIPVGGDDFNPLNPEHVAKARAKAEELGELYQFDNTVESIVKHNADWSNVEEKAGFLKAVQQAGFRSVPVSENAMMKYLPKSLPERKDMYESVAKTEYGMPPSLNRMYLDPTQVRSKYARFDPRLKHLKHLSAGVGALAFLDEDLREVAAEYLDTLAQFDQENGT